ncbi:hypothetical protein HP436_12100 [Pseudomonas sp. CrR14]|nr:hypothetical protein [Pseudomonas sp. CrR14]
MSSGHAKLYELILKLYEKTSVGEVIWEPTAREDRYITVSGGFSIVIIQEGVDYRLVIFDDLDREVENCTDVDLRNTGGTPFKHMQALFLSAKRSALRADNIIDEILNSLG